MKAWVFATLALSAATLPASVRAAPDPHIAQAEHDLQKTLQVRGRPLQPQTVQQAMTAHHVPSISVAVVDGGKIVWAKAYGVADVTTQRAATVRTTYQAGSISKPVAASGAMQLVQAGKIALDRPANDQLKSWKIPDNAFTRVQPVTVRHLWTHTGGLTVHGFPGYAVDKPVPTVVQVLEGKPPANTAAVVVDQAPGGKWRYSGGGITIGQLLMTDVTGKPFPEILREGVFGPLGMKDSSYEQPTTTSDPATGHLRDGKPVEGRWHLYPEMAAAGLWTTPTDLAKWSIALQQAYQGQSARLMSQASARTMLTSGLGHWGIGIEVVGEGDSLRFQHGGDDWGFKASLTGWMSGGRAIVVMANGDDAVAVIDPFVQAIARAYGWKGVEPKVVDAAPLTPAQRNELVGSYGKGIVKITTRGELLDAEYPGGVVELIALGGDRFLLDRGGPGAPLTIERDAGGRVTGVGGGGVPLPRDP